MPIVEYEGRNYPVCADESVLDALIRGGARIDHSCRKGSCHSCVSRALSGDPGTAARRGLDPAWADSGHFLPCLCHPEADLVMGPAERSLVFIKANVVAKRPLSDDVVLLSLEPWEQFEGSPGQYLNLRGPAGAVRSYSIASSPLDEWFVELHVRRMAGGAVSHWLHDEVREGDELSIQGPFGDCHYRPELLDRDLLLLAGGTGLAPLWGVAKEALRQGHRGAIRIYHGAAEPGGLYLDPALKALEQANARLEYHPWVDVGVDADAAHEGAPSANTMAESALNGLSGDDPPVLFVAGPAGMVFDARHRAVAAGIRREEIYADPFDEGNGYMPDDGAKMATIAADPEIWAALEEGAGLRRILDDFYSRVFADELLAPFFHRIDQHRAVTKQFEFLRSLFTGSGDYFGLRPFNAHHWMVISDELFVYREALFERCVLESGFPEQLWRRWAAIHELFRREMVKSSPRG
ncbi:MAG: FAD-binding oxidoreductase, partial [Gammaproteobacteria bacterium]